MQRIISTFKALRENEYFTLRIKDMVALLIMLVIWTTVHLLLRPLGVLPQFIISFAVMAFFVTFTALLIRKCGVVLFMYLLAVAAIPALPDLSGLNMKAYVVMLIAGIIFEVLYLLLYSGVRTIPFDTILAVAVSLATIPLWTGLSLSLYIVKQRTLDLVNLMVLDFFIAGIGALCAFLLWFWMRTQPFVMRFEYES